MKPFACLFVCFCLAALTQEVHQLKITPVPLNDEGDLDAYPRFITSIQTDGTQLFVRSAGESKIFVVQEDGSITRTYGSKGQGPGQFSGGIMAFAVNGDHLWVQQMNRSGEVQHLVNGVYENTIKLDGANIRRNTPGANSLIATDQFLLVPGHPSRGNLATVYLADGTTRHLGELIVDRTNLDLLKKTPAMNDSHWVLGDGFLFCIPKYYPMILKYNLAFEEVGRWPLDRIAPIQMLFQETVLDFEPGGALKWALPLFTDVQYFDGSLFLMAPMHLFELDATSGALLRLYTFMGNEALGAPEVDLNILSFAILDNKTMMLRGSPSWGAPLWRADLGAIR